MLGLAQRAGHLVLGTHAVKEAARRGELAGVVMAGDATENARKRVLPLLEAVQVPVGWCARSGSLGRSVGRSRIVVVGLRDRGLAGKVLEALAESEADTDPHVRGSNGERV